MIAKVRSGPLYHFTDRENLPSIRKHGLLPLSVLETRGIHPARPGGNDWSHAADRRRGIDRDVHLCLTTDHPMEYVARKDGRIGGSVYLEVSPDVLLRPGVRGSSTVANRTDARLLPLDEALEVMDLEILFGGWADLYDPDIRRRYNEARKAEILIPGPISPEFIRNLY